MSRSDAKTFVYVDTHCSLGRFPLSSGGEWGNGIGRFYGKNWELSNHPYFAIENREGSRGLYLGSWALVREIAFSRGILDKLRLFDTSPLVATELKDEPDFSQTNGFESIDALVSPDLILCDPAYSDNRDRDWRSIRDLALMCGQKGWAALIWYPVFVKEPPLDQFAGCVITEVRWPCRGANQMMRGCGMIALGTAGQVIASLGHELSELAAALGGSVVQANSALAIFSEESGASDGQEF